MPDQTGRVDTISRWAWNGFILSFLLFGIGLLVWNIKHVNAFFRRILAESTEVSIGEFVSVSSKTSVGQESLGSMHVLYDVRDGLRIFGAGFDESTTETEYVDIQASRPADLTGGFIGDDNEILSLGSRAIALSGGEVLRIYTFLQEKDPKAFLTKAEQETGRKCVLAIPVSRKPLENGIYRYKPGKGDHLVLFDHERRLLIDAHFWWLTN